MALRIFNTTSIVATPIAITAASNDTIIITEGTTIATTGGDGISSAVSVGNISIEVHGSLIGSTQAIDMGSSTPDWTGSNTVTVGVTGRIINDNNQAIFFEGSDGVLINHGEISSFRSNSTVFFSSDRAYVQNSGVIRAAQGKFDAVNFESTLDTSVNTLINSGQIISTIGQDDGTPNIAFRGGGAADQVFNTGLITGNLELQDGADLYDGRGGRVIGDVLGGFGNDRLFGGLGADRLFGEANSDIIYFDSEDMMSGAVFGGAGYDTGYYTDNATPITINLTSQEFEAYYGSAADEMIIAGSLGGFGGFVRSGAGNDLFDGSAQADNVDGGLGIDVLYGRGGVDDLAGGNGGDWLQGGLGADIFRYNSLTDSTVNGQDYIADFSTAQGDKINLTNALAGLGAVTFNSGYGAGTSVYVFAGGGGTSLVQVYTDTTLQMQIVASQPGLVASDFVF